MGKLNVLPMGWVLIWGWSIIGPIDHLRKYRTALDIYINDALSCFNFVIVVKEDTSPNKEDELRYLIKSTLFSSTTC